jgi:small subunit ribosomal protein S5
MMYWVPKTRLGKLVEKGEIKTIGDAMKTRLPLREAEIVDILLPDVEDEVLDGNMGQRMTDSGRRVRFAVTTVVGNSNGYVGLGKAKGKEVGPTIRKAIDNAKLNIIEVKRGCGSWECGCGTPHSLPFAVSGKQGSVRVTFKPAPRGIALAVGDVAKPVLKLAGIKDAWAFTKGHTKTTSNYAQAAFEALKKTAEIRVMSHQEQKMNILTGMAPEAPKPAEPAEPVITEEVKAEPPKEEPKKTEEPKMAEEPKKESAAKPKEEAAPKQVKKEKSPKKELKEKPEKKEKKDKKEAKPPKKEGEK